MTIADRFGAIPGSARTGDDVTQRTTYLDMIGGRGQGFLALAYGEGPVMKDGRLTHRRWRPASYPWPSGRASALADISRAVVDGCDVYACPLLRSTPRRRQGEAVSGHVVWVDIDDEATDDAPLVLESLGALTVASGRRGHVHGYLLLSRAVDPTAIETINRALARRTGGDAKFSENSVLRVPGTRSHKTNPPAPVRWQMWPTDRSPRWDPDELLDRLGGPVAGEERRAPRAQPVPAGEPLPASLPAHLARIRQEPAGGDRSRQVYGAVAAALEVGLTDGQVLTFVGQLAAGRERGQVGRDTALALAKLRPDHEHPGQPCDRANCPHTPRWMRPDVAELCSWIARGGPRAKLPGRLRTSVRRIAFNPDRDEVVEALVGAAVDAGLNLQGAAMCAARALQESARADVHG